MPPIQSIPATPEVSGAKEKSLDPPASIQGPQGRKSRTQEVSRPDFSQSFLPVVFPSILYQPLLLSPELP